MSHGRNGDAEMVKVVYVGDDDHHKLEFFVFCDEERLNAWRKGEEHGCARLIIITDPGGVIDKSIPLVDVVGSFNIYTGDTKGHTGQASLASSLELQNAFGPEMHEVDVMQRILDDGTAIPFHGTRQMKEHLANVTRNHSVEVRSS